MADTLSCQRETLHSQQLRSKKSIDSDHGIYRDPTNPPASYLIGFADNFALGRRKPRGGDPSRKAAEA